jgi:hypothetical protein
MTAHIFVDETKAKGYVIAAATLLEGDLAAPRKRVQALVLPRQRSLHMKDESDPRRRQIIDTILEMADTSGLTTAIYDAGREGTELARRAVCLETLVEAAAAHAKARIVLDLDESLQSWDRQRLIEYRRAAGLLGFAIGSPTLTRPAPTNSCCPSLTRSPGPGLAAVSGALE